MKINYRIWNSIHTEPGVLQGFSFRYIRFYGFLLKKYITLSLPIWFLGYDKKEAQKLHKTIELIRSTELEIPVTKDYVEGQQYEEK
jgi:hypothetical protein